MAGKILEKKIIGRITGVDFMQELCKECVRRGFTVGFLGGRGGVAKLTAECLVKKYPGLKVAFVGEEWPGQNSGDGMPISDAEKNFQKAEHIDILFVALGFPKQEEWIAKNLPRIPVTCAMGVGGAFDYISGRVPRAPKFIRKIGMEWAYRLARQPYRLARQLALPQFALEVLKERVSKH